ncbi:MULTISPECIES: TlpA disulfide reductase family protein [Butyricimonas]|uniref:TlpA disulfide reductase family protein n=1 Tax=Butyricimonas TaxID=574697 RepID=UPI0007FB4968|nr:MULTISPECIES: TlpA disulfide reductase family protein [Butyricimonas]
MRYLIVLFLFSMLACTSARVPKDHFVLRGVIPGAKDSMRVTLFLKNSIERPIGVIMNERFEIRGKTNTPTYCLLRVDDRLLHGETTHYKDIACFIENGNLEFSTPHIDSLSDGFHLYDLRKEKNYTLKGSASQEAYSRYQQQTLSCRYMIEKLEKESDGNSIDYKQLRYNKEKLKRLTKEFIRSQRNLEVNLYLAQQLKRVPFTYDVSEVEEMEQLFAFYRDTCKVLREYRESLRVEKDFVSGKPLEDVELVTPDGRKVRLLEQLNKEGYTLIDFWASWCGSCRMGIPAMEELYKRCGDRVKFISIAISDREEHWQQAMKEENMPWLQLRDEGEFMSVAQELYRITAIPVLLLISPEGKIVYRTSRVGEMEFALES